MEAVLFSFRYPILSSHCLLGLRTWVGPRASLSFRFASPVRELVKLLTKVISITVQGPFTLWSRRATQTRFLLIWRCERINEEGADWSGCAKGSSRKGSGLGVGKKLRLAEKAFSGKKDA